MPEVFTLTSFGAWHHDRNVIAKAKASSNCFIHLVLYQDVYLLFYLIKSKIIEKLLAVFLTATCFALLENKQEKGVICPNTITLDDK